MSWAAAPSLSPAARPRSRSHRFPGRPWIGYGSGAVGPGRRCASARSRCAPDDLRAFGLGGRSPPRAPTATRRARDRRERARWSAVAGHWCSAGAAV